MEEDVWKGVWRGLSDDQTRAGSHVALEINIQPRLGSSDDPYSVKHVEGICLGQGHD